MKRVLLSAYACSPIRGSEPGNGWSWAMNLAKKGYEVWCITNTEDRQQTIDECERLNLTNLHLVFVEVPYNLDVKLLNPSSKKIYLHYLLWRRSAKKIAKKLHEDKNFDVAHHATYGSLQQGSILWGLKNVKIVFGPVGGGQTALPKFKSYFGNAWKIEIIRNMVSKLFLTFGKDVRKTLKESDHILAANTDTVNMIKRAGYYNEEKVHLTLDSAVPPIMENNIYQEKKDKEVINLLWVGRMLPRKGLNLILHALSKLPADFDYKFTIVGGGELFHLLDGWIEEYKLEKSKFQILGQIPFAEVLDSYKAADIFVFCSLRDSCGSQLIEAMSFGLPVVALDIHGSSIAVLDDCGIKVKATNPAETTDGIAAAILKMSTDYEFRKSCSKNAFDHAKNNTWDKKVEYITSKFY